MAEALSVLILIGGMYVVLGVLSLRGRLRRNGFAGIRIPSTMASDSAWAAGHRAAWPLMGGMGALGLALAPAVWFGAFPVDPIDVMLGYLGVIVVGSIWMALVAGRAAKRVLPESGRRH